VDIQLESIWVNNKALNEFDTLMHQAMGINQNIGFSKTFTVEPNKKLSQPYWLAKKQEQVGSFTVEDQMQIGQDENQAAYFANFKFIIAGVPFNIIKPVQYKYVDPVRGELYQPYVVITPIIVSLTPDVMLTNILSSGKQIAQPKLQLQYKSNFSQKQVPVTIRIKQNSNSIFSKDSIIDFEAGKVYGATIPMPKGFDKGGDPNLTAEITTEINQVKRSYSSYLRSIKYDHIPDIHYFSKTIPG